MGKVCSRQGFLPRLSVMSRHSIALPLAGPFLLSLGILAGWSVPAAAQSQTSRHGGIEIGAKGVKATVLEVSLDKQGRPIKVGKPRFNKTANTTLAAVEKEQRGTKVKF